MGSKTKKEQDKKISGRKTPEETVEQQQEKKQ